MNQSQIKIGTSAWGSKISIKKAITLGNKISNINLNHFDTAPNYGSGYSHYVLNNLGKRKNILVDTKYGQNIRLSLKELTKRIYRFKNFKSFMQSFKNIKFNNYERNNEKFWNINKIEKTFNSINIDLNYCKIKSFYLHSPPYGILTKKYLEEFSDFFIKKKIFPGISDPDTKDLMLIIENFPTINLQISLNTFWKNRKDLIYNMENIHLNSVFRKLNNDQIISNNIDSDFKDEFLEILKKKKNYKIILGINSNHTLEKLKDINLNFSNIFNKVNEKKN
jgi:aryl-alcohol dehydrogenase-like predicted oxidoreductase